jgi:ABC-type uncharacterized transport system permease subunit
MLLVFWIFRSFTLLFVVVEALQKQPTFIDKNVYHDLLATKVNQSIHHTWPTASISAKSSLYHDLIQNLYPLLLVKVTDPSSINDKVPKLDPAWEWKVIRSIYGVLLQSRLVQQKA